MSFLDRFDPELLPYLSKLDPQEQQIVEYFYGLNRRPRLNIASIAELQRSPGVSSVTVRTSLNKALKKLKDAHTAAKNKDEGDKVERHTT